VSTPLLTGGEQREQTATPFKLHISWPARWSPQLDPAVNMSTDQS